MTTDGPAGWPSPGGVSVTNTHRWRGITAVAFVTAAGAVFARHPPLLFVSAVTVALAAYARFVSPPAATLTVERSVDDDAVAPGEEVSVSVTLYNTGDRLLPDVRVVDGAPPDVEVLGDSPQFGAALRPGRARTYRYTVEAPAGEAEFRPAYVATRDLVGLVERRTRVTAVGDDTVRGSGTADAATDVPLREQLSRRVGTTASDDRGQGLAFETVREYEHGDPMSRIDWNRTAKRGELRTVEMQVERSAAAVLVVDTRPAAAVVPRPGARTAVDRSVAAAQSAFEALAESGHRVGVAAFGPNPAWLAPGRGRAHRERARRLLATHEAFATQPSHLGDAEGGDDPDPGAADGHAGDTRDGDTGDVPDTDDTGDPPEAADDTSPDGTAGTSPDGDGGVTAGSGPESWLRDQLPADAQVLFFTPLCDDAVVDTVRRLAVTGTDVLVVSPDVTTDGTTGERLASLERRARVQGLEHRAIPVVDIASGQGLGDALADRELGGIGA